MDSSKDAFVLLSQFVRGLNHDLRTPLSVISNELFVLEANKAGVGASVAKVREIDQILSEAQIFLSPSDDRKSVPVQSLFERLSESIKPLIPAFSVEGETALNWECDERQIQEAFFQLLRISHEKNILLSPTVQVEERGVLVPIPAPAEQLSCGPGLFCTSLSLSEKFDSVLFPIIDSLFMLHEIVAEPQGHGMVLFRQRVVE